MTATAFARSAHWKWLVCGLLLCASVLLYLDRNCLAEDGLLVVATKNEPFIALLDAAKLTDLTIFPTVEEAIDAVLMNELENDFRNEDDPDYAPPGD